MSRSFFINWIKGGLGSGACIMKVTMRMGLNVVLNIRSFWLWNCMNVMVICEWERVWATFEVVDGRIACRYYLTLV